MYLNPKTLSNQSTYAPGLIELTNDQFNLYLQYNGFITVTSINPVTIEPDTEAWEAWKAGQPDPLDAAKESRIAESKADLEAYLEANPLTWTDGKQYTITETKQNQLTSKLLAATLSAQTSTPYTLTWNDTGEICKEWTLEELSALAFAIDARVTSLVTYQQTQEVSIRNATSQEELDAIVVDYDSVPLPEI